MDGFVFEQKKTKETKSPELLLAEVYNAPLSQKKLNLQIQTFANSALFVSFVLFCSIKPVCEETF